MDDTLNKVWLQIEKAYEDFCSLHGDVSGASPYPEYYIQNRGGGEECFVDFIGESDIVSHISQDDFSTIQGLSKQEKIEAIENEIVKMMGCDKTALKFLGCITNLSYFKFISCLKWFCQKCGSKGGKINKNRLTGILKHIGKNVNEIDLRQFVFTVPFELRHMFTSRKAINSLIKICEKIVKKKFPDKGMIAYFHAFKDSGSVFHPHVNIHVIEEKGQKLKLSLEDLQEIKYMFFQGLHGYGCRCDDMQNKMNFDYRFKQKPAHIMHTFKYMSRPCPGYINFESIRKDIDLSFLFIVEMKGFQYVRYFNGLSICKIKDADRKEEMKEMVKKADEPLMIARDKSGRVETIKRSEFDLLYRSWDYEELSSGFYRIREPERKESKKQKEKREKYNEWRFANNTKGGAQ